MAASQVARPGYRLVFTKSFRHFRTGKVVSAPPGKCFAFYVKDK